MAKRSKHGFTVLEQFRINAVQAKYFTDIENETGITRPELFRLAVLVLKQEYDKIRIPLKKEAKEKVSLGVESEKVISELKNDTKKGIDDLDIACKKQIEINKEAYIKIPVSVSINI